MDKLQVASLSKKINELQNRVMELQDRTEEQVELINVFARHLSNLAEELEYGEFYGEEEVQ